MTKAYKYTEDNNEEEPVLFDGNLFRRQISIVNFRRFYPYPYWIEEFLVKGTESRAGLIHVGLDSNNFVVAQHTTYFEISSFSTNSEDSYFLL